MWLFTIAILGSVVLALLGLLHVYWACGGLAGKGAVVPERNGDRLLNPSRGMTLLVAACLWAGSACLLAQLGEIRAAVPPIFVTGGVWVLAAVFLLRAVGDFRYVGFFKRVVQSRFAYWDTRVYSPLCLLLFASCVSAAFYPMF
jgi:hypothetical protein